MASHKHDQKELADDACNILNELACPLQTRPVHGEFLIMPLLVSETIHDNVTATQNALGLQVAVGLFQPFPLGFGNSGSDESENYCNSP